jgi:hypothetical protein
MVKLTQGIQEKLYVGQTTNEKIHNEKRQTIENEAIVPRMNNRPRKPQETWEQGKVWMT